MIEAVKLLAKTEGVLLDPTYTGKAMAGWRTWFVRQEFIVCIVGMNHHVV